MKRFGVLWTFLLLSLFVQGQNVSRSLFRDSIVPKTGHGDLYDITKSPNKFRVESDHDTLKVTFFSRSIDTTSCELAIPKGKLIGHDYDALGGHLLFAPKTGTTPDTIFDRYVQHIFTAHRYIYFTSSIWNQTQRFGHLYLLDTAKSEFHARLVAQFDYPIRQATVVHDSIYLVTGGKLYRMQYGKAVYITDVPFTCNSMAGAGRYMYFGLNGAYARLDLRTKQYRYFVYTGK